MTDAAASISTPQWIENAQKSAINFGYASGSFDSADGLVLTNHHVVAWNIAKLSTAEHNYQQTGFYARTRNDELKCPGILSSNSYDRQSIQDEPFAEDIRLQSGQG